MDCQNSVELQGEGVIPAPSSKCDIYKNKDCSTFGFGFDDSSQSDLVLLVEDARLCVSKVVLSLASPVFDRMLHSDFKESGCTELELPGKKAEDVADLLRCIYPNIIAKITHDKALKTLPILEEYQMFQLKPRCEEALMDSVCADTSTGDLFELLGVAATYDLKNLRKKCVELASNKTKEDIDEARKEYGVPSDALVEILDNLYCNLTLKVRDLETKAVGLEELETLNAERLDYIESLEQCFSDHIKFSQVVQLDESLKWKVKVIELNVDLDGDCSAEKDLTIWDENFKLLSKRTQYWKPRTGFPAKQKYCLEIKLKYVKQSQFMHILLHLVYIVVNKMGKQSNLCVMDKTTFNTDRQYTSKQLIDLSDLKDVDNGYLKNNRASVIVLMYMSEPW